MRITRFVIIAAAGLAACKNAAPSDNTVARQASADSVKSGINAMNASFAAAMKSGNVDSMMAGYAPNATVMPPNMAPMHGMQAIRGGFTAMAGQGKPTDFNITTDNVVVDGDIAIERGHYVWSMAGPNNAVMADTGKYLAHWHRVNGKWMMMDDIWNSDKAPMMPAAPARGRRS
jgi:ketosteroid isomerase-like protein